MAAENEAKNTGEKLVGKGKEAVGKVTGNDDLVAEGKTDQAKSSVKQAGEDIKDAVKGD